MNKPIAVISTEFATAPRTIQALIIDANAMGGSVEMTADRRFEFFLPCKFVGGAKRLVNRATVGYYVKDGKNVIRGAQEVSREITYWAGQSR